MYEGLKLAIVVSLRAEGIDFGDEERIDRIEEAFPAASFARLNGSTIVQLHLMSPSQRAFHEATDLMHQLRNQDSLKFVEVVPHLVNTSDIARLTGVTRQAVNKWITHPDLGFPAEKDCVGGGQARQKIWSLYSVNEWLSEVMGIDLGLELPTMGLVKQIDGYLALEEDLLFEGWKDFQTAGLRSETLVANEGQSKHIKTISGSINRSDIGRGASVPDRVGVGLNKEETTGV